MKSSIPLWSLTTITIDFSHDASPPVTPSATPRFQFPPLPPSVVPPQVFTKTLISQPIQSRAEPSLEPCYFPPVKKLAKKKALSENAKLSVFDILNTFYHFEFTPQFHTHLVKCAVTLVPCPIDKVKKSFSMGKAPKPFLTSQKASRELHRPERRRGISYGKGTTHQGKIAKKRPKKLLMADHNGNAQPADSRKSRDAKAKGKTTAHTRPDKPGPSNPPTAPSNTVTSLATTALQTAMMLKTKALKKKKRQDASKRSNTLSSTFETALSSLTPSHTVVKEFASNQCYKGTFNQCHQQLSMLLNGA
ncbi:hypothetical protein BGW80DRAFT_1253038 [Lactifluus volemus]|nr:hypothetical protein BGW80DRAFT_1253038 [Lactifluus volemus]